jgi:hypothetical protein
MNVAFLRESYISSKNNVTEHSFKTLLVKLVNNNLIM